VIQILHQDKRVFFAFFQLHGPGPVNIQKTEYQSADENNHKADNRKIFDQSERLYFFIFDQGHWRPEQPGAKILLLNAELPAGSRRIDIADDYRKPGVHCQGIVK
jgi:hypothetical protein